MPYGNEPSRYPSNQVVTTTYFGGTPSSTTKTWINTFHSGVSWYRAGTNCSPRTAGRYVVKVPYMAVKTVYKGPRLGYKIRLRDGRSVWARAPIQIYTIRYKNVPKRRNGLRCPPNALIYRKVAESHEGDTEVTGRYGSYYITYSGDIWTSFKPNGRSSTPVIGPSGLAYSSADDWMSLPRYTQALATADNVTLGQLYSKVKNQRANIGAMLVEWRQTQNMFADLVKRLANTIGALRSGNLVKAARIALPGNSKQLANDYLLVKYGIRPLLSDLDGLIEHAAITEDPQFDVIVRHKVPVERHAIETVAYDRSAALKCTTTVYSEGYVEVVRKLRLKVNVNVTREMSRLGIDTLAASTWEGIPFSFVLDWVLPVGDYLNLKDAFSGLTVVHSHRTVFVKETVTIERSFGGTDVGGWTWDNKSTKRKFEKVFCERSVNATVPPLPFPEFKDPISTSNVTSAIALLIQRLK